MYIIFYNMYNIFYILTKVIIEWPYFSLLKNQTEKQLKRVAMTKKNCRYQYWSPGIYSTVTDLARFLGWSTLHPRMTAM